MVRAVDEHNVVVGGAQQPHQAPLQARMVHRRHRGYHHHQLYSGDRRSERPHPFTTGRGFHHTSAAGRNPSGGSSSAGSVVNENVSADLAKNSSSDGAATANAALPFVGHPQLDANQTFILSGPFPKYDAERGIYVHVFTARPIPTGMTVIATPLRPNATAAADHNLNPVPKQHFEQIAQNNTQLPPPPLQRMGDEAPNAATTAGRISPNLVPPPTPSAFTPPPPPPSQSPSPPLKEGKPKTPCFMYWSDKFPEGRMVPLRQPQPPVYFHTAGEPGPKERVSEEDHDEEEDEV